MSPGQTQTHVVRWKKDCLGILWECSHQGIQLSDETGDMQPPYSHFLTGARPNVKTKDCIFAIRSSITDGPCTIIAEFERIFESSGVKVQRIEFADMALRFTKGTASMLCVKGSKLDNLTIDDVQSISLFNSSYGTKPLHKTWFPDTFGVISRYGDIINAGFCADVINDKTFHRLIDLFTRWRSLSIGRVRFPAMMSPRGYMASATVSPNDPAVGDYSSDDAERVVNFRRNAGLGNANKRSPFREIYTENFLSKPIDDVTMSLLKRAELSVEHFNDRFLRVRPTSLRSFKLADDLGLTLSGLAPEALSKITAANRFSNRID